MTWEAPLEDGGVDILDYRITYDQGIDSFEVIAYGIQVHEYITTVPLVAGNYYAFKLESRNEVGFSDYSNTISVYAA